MKVGLAIFTLNESRTIKDLFSDLKSQQVQFTRQIIVDDSTDDTPYLAQQNGFEVISGGGSLGGAFSVAMDTFRDADIDYLVTMDGDGQANAKEIEVFLGEAQEKRADLVLGSRFLKEGLIDYKYPRWNRWGVALLALYLRLETGQRITDSHGGVRCYSKKFIKECKIRGRHTYVQESILHARDKGLKIIEIPSEWLKRSNGSSRVVSSKWRYAMKVAPILFLRSRRIAPLLAMGIGASFIAACYCL